MADAEHKSTGWRDWLHMPPPFGEPIQTAMRPDGVTSHEPVPHVGGPIYREWLHPAVNVYGMMWRPARVR